MKILYLPLLRAWRLAGFLLLALPFAGLAQGPGSELIRISKISDAIEGGMNAIFRIGLYYPRPLQEGVTIQLSVSGTATANTDYTFQGLSGPNTVVIPAGSVEAYLTLPTVNDGIIEGPETVTIQLLSAQSPSRTFTIDAATASIAIVDGNAASSTPIQVVGPTDGAEPSTAGSFMVKLAGVATSAWPVTIGYSLSNTAQPGDDFRLGTIVIPPNTNSVTVPVPVIDDQVIEFNERIIIRLLSGSATDGGGNAFIFPPDPANDNVSVYIADNDATAAHTVLSLHKQNDAAEPATHGTFSVGLPAGYVCAFPITLDYTLQGTATEGADYSLTQQILPAYTNSTDLRAIVVDDGLEEGTETVIYNLVGGRIGSFTNDFTPNPATNPVSLTIGDNDATPLITQVTVPADGTYRVGQALRFEVHFNKSVVINTAGGIPSLSVTIGTTIVQALYTSQVDSNVMRFQYAVQPGDLDLDGIRLGAVLNRNGSTIQDQNGTDVALPLSGVGNTSLVFVNTLQPSVVLSGTPSPNNRWTMTITFSEAVTGLTMGDFQVTNTGLSGLSTSDNITYTVELIPVSPGPVRIQLPADQAQNSGGNGNTASNTLSYVYDPVAPVVSPVAVPANGYYKAGDVLNFTVNWSEAVRVSGAGITLPVVIGSTTVQATYTGGTGTNALHFQYTVQPGNNDMDGIALGATLNLNGNTIRDLSTNDAVLTLNNVGNTSQVFVNTMIPTVVLSGNPPGQGAWTLTVIFSEPVTGFELADIEVTNATLSNFQPVNGFTYTVLVTPASGGTVTLRVPADAAVNIGNNGNEASLTFSYMVDSAPPVVSGVLASPNGYYKAGMLLSFPVAFSETVVVTGTGLSLPVTIGTTTVQAAYASGSGSPILQFHYTVLNGQMDMDGIALGNALVLNSGTLRDEAGNNAVLTLNNVANTSGIFVNTAHPTVTVSTTAPARVNAPFVVRLVFSEAVTGLIATDITVTNGSASNLQTTDNISFTATITPTASGAVSIQVPADGAVNIGDNGNQASNTLSRTADLTPPVITAGQSFQILENSAAGTAIGSIQGNDAAGTLQGWTITGDPSGGAFALNAATGALTVNNTNLLNQHAGQTVTLQVMVSDGLNTSVATAVRVEILAVNKAPTLDPIGDLRLCATTAEQTITLTGASAVEPGQTYGFRVTANQAYFDELSVSNAGVLRYRLKAGINSGQATITVTIQDNGGTANGGVDTLRRSFTATVLALPEVTIQSDKGPTVSKGDMLRLTASGGNSYTWADAPGIVEGQQTATLTIRPQQNAAYRVTVRNAAGCEAEGNISIAIVEDFKVDATNIITPNGDGKNDRWVVRNIDSYPNNEVKIFDRAGRLVYTRRNYNNEWDGRLNGQPLAEGAYYYILTINNGARTAKGAITIIRDRY